MPSHIEKQYAIGCHVSRAMCGQDPGVQSTHYVSHAQKSTLIEAV